MLLVTAATAQELDVLQDQFSDNRAIAFLVTGIGLVETTYNLTAYLAQQDCDISGVLNVGVGGAFPGSGLKVLDLCLASSEVIGDMAICFEDRLSPLGSSDLVLQQFFACQGHLLERFHKWCLRKGIDIHQGPFVSVNCVSGTRKRGEILATTYEALSENMEGAAVARVCQGYGLDWLEVRCMSNMVEDRDTANWRLSEAAAKCSGLIEQFLIDYQS